MRQLGGYLSRRRQDGGPRPENDLRPRALDFGLGNELATSDAVFHLLSVGLRRSQPRALAYRRSAAGRLAAAGRCRAKMGDDAPDRLVAIEGFAADGIQRIAIPLLITQEISRSIVASFFGGRESVEACLSHAKNAVCQQALDC